MPYEYALTYRDYLDGQKLYLKRRIWARLNIYFLLYLLPVIAVLGSGFTICIMVMRHQQFTFQALLPLAIAPFVALLFQVNYWWGRKRGFKNRLPPGMQEVPVVFSFDEEGIRSAVPGRNEGRFFWNAILDSAEDERMFLLFVRKKAFLFVPKRAMPEYEWARLRAIVQAKVKKS